MPNESLPIATICLLASCVAIAAGVRQAPLPSDPHPIENTASGSPGPAACAPTPIPNLAVTYD